VRSPAFVGGGVAASAVAALLGYAQKLPCSSGGDWNSFTSQFQHACYTDIYPLYYNEGLSRGQVPYAGHAVEYPVLIGAMMQLGAWAVHSVSNPFSRGADFYYVTIAMLTVCLVAGVLATGYAASREGDAQLKAALMTALSPGLILAAFINWDLLAMALTAGGIAAWAARRELLAGALLGLGVAAKFYPLLIFAALLLLCLRSGRIREFCRALVAGVIAWLVVNLPIALTATAGWGRFYAFSRSRGADWGSIWHMFEYFNLPVIGNSAIGELNWVSSGCFAVAFIAVAVLALAAPRRPRLPQLCFLLLASFLMLNKVWSPQYVIWLVPFAVLARPRLWPYILWQLTEVAYFFGIWFYFVGYYHAPGIAVSTGWYFTILVSRFLAVGLYSAVIVVDILRPERDVVRVSGQDDPAGGVLDGAADWLVLRWERGARRPIQVSVSLPRSHPMSVASPASGVSQTTGAPAARTTSRRTPGSMVPESRFACLSAPESNASRELLQCTRSIRPVIALIRSTASARSMPAELAWHVSRQNPISAPSWVAPVTASHSRAMASSDLAIAPVPPAVFSMNIGSGRSIRSAALRQFSRPSAGSTPEVTCPPCTISAFAPIDAAAFSC
jgi:uncharacterized membrane protein